MRVIALLLSPRYQLSSEATPRKIVGTEWTIKVLLPEYQVYKCLITNSMEVNHLICNKHVYYTSLTFFYINFIAAKILFP
jgi:hypothetical protein